MRNENATVEAKAAQVLANNRTSLITVRQKLATARQAQAAVEDELSPTYGTVRVRQPLPWPAHTIPSSAVCHHIDSRHGSDTVVETVTRSWRLHFCTAISRTHPIQQLPSSHLPGRRAKGNCGRVPHCTVEVVLNAITASTWTPLSGCAHRSHGERCVCLEVYTLNAWGGGG